MKGTARREPLWIHGAWLLLYFVIILASRVYVGTALDDYGAYEDEPAHLVTAAMLRDYASSFDPAHPVEFSTQYYLHYPKVAIGQWPPVLHMLLGGIMLPFGVSRFGLLIGTCLLAAMAGWAVRLLARHGMPTPLPGLLGLLFLSMPLVQGLSGAPMTELLVAALGGFAVHHYSIYMHTGSSRRAWMFGVFTLLAVLTKGNSIGLVLVPIIAPILNWRPDRIITRGTVGAGLIVGIAGIAWYSQTMRFSQGTWAGQDREVWEYAAAALRFYSSELGVILGSVPLALALCGVVTGFLNPETRGQTSCLVAWFLGLCFCYLFLRTGIEARHLAPVLPVCVVLAGRGALWIGKLLGWQRGQRAIPATCLIAVGFGLQAFAPALDHHRGFREAVDMVWNNPSLHKAPWLIASDSGGEGLLVAEAVLRDPAHDELQVLRASKVLATADWLGQGYEMTYKTEEELGDFLERIPVSVVFLDLSMWRRHWFPHQALLFRFLESHPDRFQLLAAVDTMRNGLVFKKGLRIYRQVGFETMTPNPLQLEDILQH